MNEAAPPASDLNPEVSKSLAQVIGKAMAKGPWNRFASAKEFADHLQRAVRGEAIEAFDAARIQPRIDRAKKAIQDGDLGYAQEILTEVQFEGHVDSEITSLLEQVRDGIRTRALRQLLDGARARMEEDELPLAWQKVQEALQRDPGNLEALGLQADIETRRSDQQIEKWRKLVHQHLHNNAFDQARQAVDEIRKLGRNELDAAEMTEMVRTRESAFRKACELKEQEFQSAMSLYGNGEISTALSKLERVLELGAGASGTSHPGREQMYRETYEKIRSEWESVQEAGAQVERSIASGDLGKAADLATEFSAKHPNDFGLQALKLRVEDLLRQEKSGYIAEIGRRLDEEPDLDRAVQSLEEALKKYPGEPGLQERVTGLGKKRDLVNSIVTKARHYEEQNLPTRPSANGMPCGAFTRATPDSSSKSIASRSAVSNNAAKKQSWKR